VEDAEKRTHSLLDEAEDFVGDIGEERQARQAVQTYAEDDWGEGERAQRVVRDKTEKEARQIAKDARRLEERQRMSRAWEQRCAVRSNGRKHEVVSELFKMLLLRELHRKGSKGFGLDTLVAKVAQQLPGDLQAAWMVAGRNVQRLGVVQGVLSDADQAEADELVERLTTLQSGWRREGVLYSGMLYGLRSASDLSAWRHQKLSPDLQKQANRRVKLWLAGFEAGTIEISDEDDQYDAPCLECGTETRTDFLLLCEGCDAGCHTYCTKQKFKTVPKGDWFCETCDPFGNADLEISEGERCLMELTEVKHKRSEENMYFNTGGRPNFLTDRKDERAQKRQSIEKTEAKATQQAAEVVEASKKDVKALEEKMRSLSEAEKSVSGQPTETDGPPEPADAQELQKKLQLYQELREARVRQQSAEAELHQKVAGSKYSCEGHRNSECDFSGSYSEVETHEKSCALAQTGESANVNIIGRWKYYRNENKARVRVPDADGTTFSLTPTGMAYLRSSGDWCNPYVSISRVLNASLEDLSQEPAACLSVHIKAYEDAQEQLRAERAAEEQRKKEAREKAWQTHLEAQERLRAQWEADRVRKLEEAKAAQAAADAAKVNAWPGTLDFV
jgi:hypothetical protein